MLGRRRVAPVAGRGRRRRPVRVLAVVGVSLGHRLGPALPVLLVVAVAHGLVRPAGVRAAAAVGRAVRVRVGGAAGHELEGLPVGAEVLDLPYRLRGRRHLKQRLCYLPYTADYF